jgi:hypothetical protein
MERIQNGNLRHRILLRDRIYGTGVSRSAPHVEFIEVASIASRYTVVAASKDTALIGQYSCDALVPDSLCFT